MLLTLVDKSMPMELQVSHYCFNTMLCRWPPCCLIQLCTYYTKNVTTFSIALGVPWIPSGIHCFKSSVLARGVFYNLFSTRPREKSLVLQDEASRWTRWCPWSKKWVCLGTVSWKLASNLCCVSNFSKQYCAWWQSVWKRCSVSKLVFKFWVLLGVPGKPDSLITLSCSTRLLQLGLYQKQVIRNMSRQYWLFIINAGVCWKT
jgi:hypothetical protein